tara:strand:- start:382 stop:543 length:162 start_codon:yes stop_codon:yes gene_type:complete
VVVEVVKMITILVLMEDLVVEVELELLLQLVVQETLLRLVHLKVIQVELELEV